MTRSLRVLLVDDDESSLTSYRRLINALGHQDVITAKDGHQAARIYVDDETIDAVICDVRMKPESGIFFLQYINRSRKIQVPVLMHSGEETFRQPGMKHEYDLAKDIHEVFPFARFKLKVSPDVHYIENFLKEVLEKKK